MQKIKMFKDGVETEIEVAAVYETQEALENELKSANSRGKGEILKTLGVTSVDEAKSKMGAHTEDQSKVESWSGDVASLRKQLETEQHRRIASELKIKPELANDLITLTEATMTEGADFATELKGKAEAFKAIDGGKPAETATEKRYGSPKGNSSPDKLTKEDEAEMESLRNLDPMNR